ncbi:MAG: tyrosine-type recombinase/integrase [Rhodobacteraceae bacterium]|nr:tyrosine-type recombinase/integrase [Paracoccaceae bacterium]
MAELTGTYVDRLEPTERDLIYWDERLHGFGVRVKPSGVKSYLIQYRNHHGTSKRKTIAKHSGPLAFEEVRELARSKLASVALGKDPVNAGLDAKRAWTVKQLAEFYLIEAENGNLLTRRRVRKSESTLATDKGRIARHIIPLIGSKLVRELKRADVQRLFGEIKAGRTAVSEKTDKLRGRSIVTGGEGTAKRTVGLLSGMLSFAIELGLIDGNPAHGVRLPRDNKRIITNVDHKYSALGRALLDAENRSETWQAIAIIRLVALTGMRKGEAVALKWEEVDFETRTLNLASAKSGLSVRPMSQKAEKLLQKVLCRFEASAFVFPAISIERRPYGGLPRAWARITGSENLSIGNQEILRGFSLHGLRHCYAATAGALSLTLPTISALLGHGNGGVTAGYTERVDMVLKTAADCVSDEICSMMSDETNHGNVHYLSTFLSR